MPEEHICKLKDARAYINGLMEEVPESSPAWKILWEAWGVLQVALTQLED